MRRRRGSSSSCLRDERSAGTVAPRPRGDRGAPRARGEPASLGGSVRRDLPWRRTRDPWAVLVAELMLQQTQVARVIDRYPAFLVRFPTPAAMATAPLADVLDAWAGLGYYRRARDLHRAARAIVDEHGGVLPDTLDALRALPGIGPYTARAVLAFAHERDVGVVDTNAARVLARAVAGAPMTASAVQRLADALVPAGDGWRTTRPCWIWAPPCARRVHPAATSARSRTAACGTAAAGASPIRRGRPQGRRGRRHASRGRTGSCAVASSPRSDRDPCSTSSWRRSSVEQRTRRHACARSSTH
jgi:endonuclease III